MRVPRIKQNSIGRRIITAVAMIFLSAFVAPAAMTFAEDDATPPDTTPPILTLHTLSEVRNVTTMSLAITDDHPQYASLRIMDAARATVPDGFKEDDGGATTLSLTWKTNDVPDGDYIIAYSARDTLGNENNGEMTVKVNNAKPLVVLNDVADGRTIGGAVSRRDVTFQTTIDGKDLPIQPTMADAPDASGAYIWSLTLPSDIADGAHAIHIIGTANDEGGHVSDPVDKTVTITTPAPSTPVGTTTSEALPIGKPTLELAPEIGRFVAPVIPTTPESRLFGVAVTDLTGNANPAAIVPSLPTATSTSQSMAREQHVAPLYQSDVPPLAATSGGWAIAGVAWYWWVGVVAMTIAAGSAITWTVRRRDQRAPLLVRAESLQ